MNIEISTTTSTTSLPSSAPSWGRFLVSWVLKWHSMGVLWVWRWLPHHPTHPGIPFAEQPVGQRQSSWLLFCGKHPVWQEVFLIWFLPPTSHWSDKIDSLFQSSSFTWQHFGNRAPVQCSFCSQGWVNCFGRSRFDSLQVPSRESCWFLLLFYYGVSVCSIGLESG